MEVLWVRIPWNKGKTKFTDPRLKEEGERYYKQLQNGDIVNYWLNKKHSEENEVGISKILTTVGNYIF